MSTAALRELHELREKLDRRFPNATPLPRRTVDGAPTGIAALDAILPNGGFPRGQLSVWTPYGGATAVLRSAVSAAVDRGERAVWIDGSGTIAGPFWVAGPLLVRPRSRVAALRAAETLARSGGFAIVVLTGVELEGTEHVRVSRAAHDGGGALVALTNVTGSTRLKVTSTLAVDEYVWARDPCGAPAAAMSAAMHVRVTSLGWNRRARIVLPVQHHETRSALDVMLPDRRGTRLRSHAQPQAQPHAQPRARSAR